MKLKNLTFFYSVSLKCKRRLFKHRQDDKLHFGILPTGNI